MALPGQWAALQMPLDRLNDQYVKLSPAVAECQVTRGTVMYIFGASGLRAKSQI